MNIKLDFEKKHTTSHAIITLVERVDIKERVSKTLDTGKYMVGVSFDLKKAFDTVDHNILLAKLKQYDIRGNTHSWLTSEETHTAGLRVTYQTENNMLNTIILNPIQKR